MAPASRQDVQNMLNVTTSKVLDRLISKYDIQTVCEQSRDRIINSMQNLHTQDQRLIGQTVWQLNQTLSRLVQVETRMLTLEQQMKVLIQSLQKFMQQQQTQTSQNTFMLSTLSATKPADEPVATQPATQDTRSLYPLPT